MYSVFYDSLTVRQDHTNHTIEISNSFDSMKLCLSLSLGVLLWPQCSGGQSLQLMGSEDKEEGIDNNKDVEHFFGGDPFFSTMFDDLSLFFDDMASMQDRIFSDFWNHDQVVSLPGAKENRLAMPIHPFLRGGTSNFLPQLQQLSDVVDDDEKFQVSMDLPAGLSLDDVQIEVQDGGTRLVIHGETRRSNSNTNDGDDEGNGAFRFQSTGTASFTQSFSMDSSVLVDQMVATYKDGRLTVSAPKNGRKVKNLNHAIPIQDLDAIAAGVESSQSHSQSNRPHFLHKSLPFVQGATNKEEYETNKDTLEVADRSVQQGDSEEEAIKESEDIFGGSSL